MVSLRSPREGSPRALAKPKVVLDPSDVPFHGKECSLRKDEFVHPLFALQLVSRHYESKTSRSRDLVATRM